MRTSRILSGFACVLASFAVSALIALPCSAQESGTIGGCTWVLDDNGVFTVSGTGEIDHFGTVTAGEIKSIVFESGITKVDGLGPFDDAVSVSLPDTLVSFDGDCGSLPSLEKVIVDENNPAYSAEDGILFNKDKTEIVLFPASNGMTEYEIPQTVTEIGNRAFAHCYELSSVTLPEDGVTKIGTGAFYFCENLSDVDIPDSVASIGEAAFLGCKSFTKINIPDSVTELGMSAFSSCTGAESIYIGSGITEIPDSAFFWCTSLTEVTVPENVQGKIGDSAFSRCGSLKSVSLPEGITEIGNRAFSECKALESITLPDSVTAIDDFAFDDCEALKKIDVGAGLKTIGEQAFLDSGIESLSLPAPFEYLGSMALENCDHLAEITVDEDCAAFSSENGNLFNKDKTKLIRYAPAGAAEEYKIPDTVTFIRGHAFRDCANLKRVTLPESMTSVSWYAFYLCISLEEVNFPSTVKEIESYAFWGCNKLQSVTLPEGLESIGERAFDQCFELKAVTFAPGLKEIGDWAFDDCKLQNVYLTGSVDEWNDVYVSPLGNGELLTTPVHAGGDTFARLVYDPNCESRFSTATAVIVGGNAVVTDKVPNRAGFEFLGWASEKDVETAEYNAGDVIENLTESKILYAVWERKAYTEITKHDGEPYKIECHNVPVGSKVIAAGYYFGDLVYVNMMEYEGETLEFSPKSAAHYPDRIRVYVWDDKMRPVTEAAEY